VLGLQLGLILVLAIAGAGVGSLLLASPLAFNIVVKTVGALYLIYLGVASGARKPRRPVPSSSRLAAHPSFGKRVLTGFLTNATNPKGIIFMVAVLPQFISKDAAAAAAAGDPGRDHGHHRHLVMHGYATLASSMQRLFRDAARDAHPEPLFRRGAGAVGGADAVLRQARHGLAYAGPSFVVQICNRL
jgi:homoserine/homoserine lactone efflux protein